MADSEKQKKLTSSSSSSSFFSSFTSKGVFQETESMMMSPTSILDSKPFSGFKKNPFWSETSNNKTNNKKRCCYSEKLDSKGVGVALLDETEEARMVVFGSQLKIQIPPLAPEGERVFKGCVSASELEQMELSEDYTRVICHGPNPRTTHIFGNCIIQSTPSVSPKLDPSHSFLTVCFLCNKNLGHGKDIYMYRGERAFCSNECRYQGMLMEEAEEAVYGT
ncbi:FCS-Like Zinc finger 8 [Arachis duranensis]|uniref:FCS-Like Zinc finger 8 n=1 Tax=Arachis duranensis TaxID=130453 RepID=N1NEV8_ARADU|nr:FCS-Like Zinc finger 8 [Arachis duranensis]CCW28755.1 hypothetical protein ARAX_ADH035P21-010 [Arachis duranensis]